MNCSGRPPSLDVLGRRAEQLGRRAERFAERAVQRRQTREDRWSSSSATSREARKLAVAADKNVNKRVLGAVLLAIGGNWLLAELGFFSLGWPGLFAIALMTLGASMIGTAKAGRTRPLIALGVVLTLGLAMSSGVGDAFADRAVGDQVQNPQSAAELRPLYENDIGDITLDLSDLTLETGLHDVDVKLGVGDIHVIVPAGMAVNVEAKVATLGDIELFDQRRDGFGPRAAFEDPQWADAPARLDLELDVAVGDITVERA